jgi:mannonate dehydratase
MMKISIQFRLPTESLLKWASQIGIDFVDAVPVPGIEHGQGCVDQKELMKLRRWIRSFGLDMNRVSLPSVEKFLMGQAGGEKQVENVCKTIKILGENGIPIARPSFAPSSGQWPEAHREPRDWPKGIPMSREHRGRYMMRGVHLETMKKHMRETGDDKKDSLPEEWWSRVEEFYKTIIPIAEEYDVKIAMHPSDSPLSDTPFSSLGLHRIIDIYSSPNNGLLYCVGTRHEAGGTQLVLDEINYYGRKGKIFLVHFRNVRGSFPTAGGFEEVLLDDGDMNMYQILLALQKVGYEGCLNPDHHPELEEWPNHMPLVTLKRF